MKRIPWFLAAILIDKWARSGSRLFVVWNLLGILDLVVAVGTAALNISFATGAAGEITVAPMAQMPLVLVPAYRVPLFAFYHAASNGAFSSATAGAVRTFKGAAWRIVKPACPRRCSQPRQVSSSAHADAAAPEARWISQSLADAYKFFQKKIRILSISPPLVRREGRGWVQPVQTIRQPGTEPKPQGDLRCELW